MIAIFNDSILYVYGVCSSDGYIFLDSTQYVLQSNRMYICIRREQYLCSHTGRIPRPRFCQTNPSKMHLASESPNEDVRIKSNVAFSSKMPMCIFDCQKATTTIYNIMLLL
jgi:hypothetical protein